MKNAKFSEAQIMAILRQAENGEPVSELCREHGMSSASFYKKNLDRVLDDRKGSLGVKVALKQALDRLIH